jgi:2',3'-cyclic-nucleotide 2'-phosphodiesterase (5'-nucleotidase family)
MQARITITSGVALASLLFLTQCSTTSALRWPEKNPFAETKGQSFEDLARERGAKPVRIAFTGNVLGESEPCGCAVGPKGGLDRRLNFLRTEVEKGPYPDLVVDAGNTLFPSFPVDSARQSEFRVKAQALMRSQASLGVDVQNIGHVDLALGAEFLEAFKIDSRMRLVSANWADAQGQLLFAPSADVTLKDGRVVTVTGVSGGFLGAALPKVKALDPAASLQAVLAKVPSDRLVVVLSDMGIAQDEKLAAKLNRPLIIVGSRDMGSLSLPRHSGRSLIVQSAFRGQQWGLLDFAWQPGADGWFNTPEAARFQDLWENLASRRAKDLLRESGDERRAELARHDDVARDLLAYAPGDLKKKSLYRHGLYDLTDAYLGKNELSKVMTELRKIK